jgi:hypothetical protein
MMKLSLLTSICLLGAFSLAAPLELRAGDLKYSTATPLPAPRSAPWSVLGSWQCTHPDWTGVVAISTDGKFFQADMHESGHWTLTTLQDRVILVLAWDNWPAETVTMMNPDEFSGRVRAGGGQEGQMKMLRIAEPVGYETKVWHQGEPPVRLIRKDEGFCALTSVTGCFQGGGEKVSVYVADDGYWYLGGQSQQEGVAAECIVVRNRTGH